MDGQIAQFIWENGKIPPSPFPGMNVNVTVQENSDEQGTEQKILIFHIAAAAAIAIMLSNI